MTRKRYFLDTEFWDSGSEIALISIALVCEDGRELYYCNHDWEPSQTNDWIEKNVVPLLPERPKRWGAGTYPSLWRREDEITNRILEFIGDDEPEFWAYYADYDWVALCQLFGPMVALPKNFPRYCLDIKQLAVMLGNAPLPGKPQKAHDALHDARWNRQAHGFLMELWEVRLGAQ